MTILEVPLQPVETQPADDDYEFHCCYCAKGLDDSTADWVGVSLYSKDTGSPGQAWFAHESCFRSKLHPEFNFVEGGIAWKGDRLP